MESELRQTVSSVFERELKDAGFERYIHWLLPGLFTRFRHRSPTELETAVLLEEVEVGTYEEYGWEDTLEAIDLRSGERAKVESWLKEFFAVGLPHRSPEDVMLTRSRSTSRYRSTRRTS